MKKLLLFIFLLITANAVFAQTLKFSSANNNWNADSLGNFRAIVRVHDSADVARAYIEWRRRDEHPELKRIIVVDSATDQKILNIKPDSITRESGEVYFQPTSGAGTYYVYYMPYKNEGRSNYPKGVYLKPEQTASQAWLNKLNDSIPFIFAYTIQSVNAFNSMYPMEIIAAKSESDSLLKSAAKNFIVFPEDRMHPIKMTNDLPQRWIGKGIQTSFTDTALRDENFSFQLGIYALKDLQNVRVKFTDLISENGNKISTQNMSCLNT
ncbi:MAG: glycoside hydrolase domain-containing protein, partial [Parafilimonas sp.]